MALLPLVVLDSDTEVRCAQLAKLAKGSALGLGLTDSDAIAACSMGNISSSDRCDYGNMVSGRVVHFKSLKARMRLVVEEVNLDTLMAAALLSMRMDGVGVELYDATFNPDAQQRRIELGHLPLWSPATDAGGEYGDDVLSAEALMQWVSREDISPRRRIMDIREYLETGTFEGCRRLCADMQDARFGLKVEYRRSVAVAGGRIAVLESAQSRYALEGAAARADVVVWVNPAASLPGSYDYVRKITIWQKHAGLVNFAGAIAELAEREAGWVGGAAEGCSPEAVSSTLEVATVVRTLLRHHVDGGRGAREYLDEALDDDKIVAAVRDGSSSNGSDLLERVLLYRALS